MNLQERWERVRNTPPFLPRFAASAYQVIDRQRFKAIETAQDRDDLALGPQRFQPEALLLGHAEGQKPCALI